MKRIGMMLLTLALLLCGIPVSAEETRTVVGRPLQEKLRESSPDDVERIVIFLPPIEEAAVADEVWAEVWRRIEEGYGEGMSLTDHYEAVMFEIVERKERQAEEAFLEQYGFTRQEVYWQATLQFLAELPAARVQELIQANPHAKLNLYRPYRLIRCGDVNEDEKIDAADARMLLQYTVGKAVLPSLPGTVFDVNLDGRIDTGDARYILQNIVGKGYGFDSFYWAPPYEW